MRIIFILVFLIIGLGLVIGGWRLTGRLAGLGLMLLGLVLLLTALMVYNAGYSR